MIAMLPIGLLMKEHRLIERVVLLVERELEQSKKSLKVDSEFIQISIDFFRTYADLTHHGKEEQILFHALENKNISEDYKKTLHTLLNDHKTAREIIQSLEKANNGYSEGYHANIKEIQEKLQQLIILYPQHITIEDTQFFFPIMEYFSTSEHEAMLQEFYNFDRTVIHERYRLLVESLEKKSYKK